jgi:hypothetical protein
MTIKFLMGGACLWSQRLGGRDRRTMSSGLTLATQGVPGQPGITNILSTNQNIKLN